MAELKSYRGYYLWLYVPNKAAAAIFTALFLLATAAVTWRMVKTRAWFCSVFAIGGLLEVAGYAARAVAKDKTDQLMPFVIQSVLILVAPAVFAASVYMTLGRIMRSIKAESLSVIPTKWLTKIFVAGDIVSFAVQGSGAGFMVMENKQKIGEGIILGGLFVQIIIFGVFAVVAAIFHRRVRQQLPNTSEVYGNDWRRLMIMLYAVSFLIMVRSIFRVIEYIMGHDGYLLKNEWTLYVFDAALIFAAMGLFAWIFPGKLDLRLDDVELSEDVAIERASHGRSK